MSNALIIIAIGFAIFLSWNMGVNHGLDTAPELVQYKRDRDADTDQFMAAIAEAPSGREAVCKQVFDLVWEKMISEE